MDMICKHLEMIWPLGGNLPALFQNLVNLDPSGKIEATAITLEWICTRLSVAPAWPFKPVEFSAYPFIHRQVFFRFGTQPTLSYKSPIWHYLALC